MSSLRPVQAPALKLALTLALALALARAVTLTLAPTRALTLALTRYLIRRRPALFSVWRASWGGWAWLVLCSNACSSLASRVPCSDASWWPSSRNQFFWWAFPWSPWRLPDRAPYPNRCRGQARSTRLALDDVDELESLGSRRRFDRCRNQADFLVPHPLQHADHERVASRHPGKYVLKGCAGRVADRMRRQHAPEPGALLAETRGSLGRQVSIRKISAGG